MTRNNALLVFLMLSISVIYCSGQLKKPSSIFENPVRYSVEKSPASVAIADINRDGKPDVIVANSGSNNVTILLGDGKGKFTQSKGSPFSAGTSPNDIAVGDFNGDGKQDLIFPNHGVKNVTVLLGDGSGGFVPGSGSPIIVQSRPHPHGIAVGDFNGDRKTDFVVESWGNNQVEVHSGKGNGDFQTTGALFNVGTMPYQRLRSGDVNNDGTPDIVTTNFEGNNVSVLLGNAKGGFVQAEGSPFPVARSPFSVAVADVNGDHHPDLAIAHYSGQENDHGADGLTILLGNGKGKFTAAPGSPFPVNGAPVMVGAGDVNGDGLSDIATANYSGNSVTVYLAGKKKFVTAPGSPFAIGRHPEGIAVGDLNGDGKADIVTADIDDNSITILFAK